MPRPVRRLIFFDTETTGLVAWTVHGFRIYASRPRNAHSARSLAACALHKLSQAPSTCAPPSHLKPFFFHWFCCHHLSSGLELFQPGLQGGCKSPHVIFFTQKDHPEHQKLKFCLTKNLFFYSKRPHSLAKKWNFSWKNNKKMRKKVPKRAPIPSKNWSFAWKIENRPTYWDLTKKSWPRTSANF